MKEIIKILFLKKVTINAIAFSYYDQNQIYTYIAEKFNKYSEDNNLNIELNLNLLTLSNSTSNINDYGSFLESYFRKNENENPESQIYDIVFYDAIYSNRYGPYLLNLREALPHDHIDLYNQKILNESCSYKNSIVGLPVYLDFTYLFSNLIYLNKYNKTIPETWEELKETAKYIIKEEHSRGNTNLVGYNSLFTGDEMGTASIDEFIYSYRESIDSPFPKITGSIAIEALEMLKSIKNEISSVNPDYKITRSPGGKKGISGSSIVGYNIGISITSGIPSLYDEEDICLNVDCKLYKSIQIYGRDSTLLDDYDVYSTNFRHYIYEFLFYNETAKNALQKIEDMYKMYYVSLVNNDEYRFGFTIAMIYVVNEIVYFFSSLITFILLFGTRIFAGFMNKENNESKFIKSVNKLFLENEFNKDKINTTVVRQEEFNKFEQSATNTVNNNNSKQNSLSLEKEKSDIINMNNKTSLSSKRNSCVPNVLLTIYNYHNTKTSTTEGELIDEEGHSYDSTY
ncbi:hypothetical protein PIROE2DRAFT_11901 [Piromyces sp. E2]|nr:hypothetical protein PIROE2DRAFT_11901 [Piromyces sp. E2]|eukprot:OUM61936.1 hypothetical protein PIROE2DRAFT_11901 [Piromyces sp. E2]